MAVKRIDLWNFQPHKRKSIKLHPRVTVLVGESFSGKSAVVRALRLLCLNQPRGSSYVRRGSSHLRVRATLEGHTVEVTRGKGKNAYHLDGKRYAPEKRRDVPEAIARLLNVGHATFQQQDEPHFWLYDSPGQVAKQLNEIADLETMDKVLGRVANEVRRSSAEVEVTKARLKEARERLAELRWVPALVAKLERLERLESQLSAIRSRIASAGRSAETVSELRSVADRLSESDYSRKTAVRSGRKATAYRERVKKLEGLVDQIRQAMPTAVPNPKRAFDLRQKADAYATRRRKLESLITEIQKKEKLCEELRSEVSAKGSSSRTRTPRCPTCGRRLRSSR